MKYTYGKNGRKLYKGFYTKSCMPNQKQKRMRKSVYQKVGENITAQMMKCNINGMGIIGAILTIGFAPLNIGWKIYIAGLFLLSCIHVEVKNDDK